MTVAPKPVLVVRVSNWIGDVVLTLPALKRLAGVYQLHPVGRGWLGPLLAAYGWSCHVYPRHLKDRVALLRSLRRSGEEVRALCLPTSLSSALEFRLAGLPAVGYAKEGRSLLLSRALPLPRDVHMQDHFGRLADAMLDDADPALPALTPDDEPLRLSPQAIAEAAATLAAAGVSTPFVVLCPFASGAIDGQDKRWPAFPELAQVLARRGMQAVACPGPGEELALEAGFPTVVALPGLSVAAYAAVISQAAAVIANDTGPGHLAAALLVPLISVLGPTDPARWGARGRSVRILRRWPEWPGVEEVVQALPSAHPGKPQAFIRT